MANRCSSRDSNHRMYRISPRPKVRRDQHLPVMDRRPPALLPVTLRLSRSRSRSRRLLRILLRTVNC